MGHDGNHERTSISITEGRDVTECEAKFISFSLSYYQFVFNVLNFMNNKLKNIMTLVNWFMDKWT